MTASSTSPQITSLDFLPLDEYVDRPRNKCVTFKLDATDEDGQYDEDHSIARTHATFQLDYYDDDGHHEIDIHHYYYALLYVVLLQCSW